MIYRKILSRFRCYSTTSSILMDTKNIIYRKHNPVVLIGINNPDTRNALNEETVNDLNEAFSRFEKDEEISAGVIFGEGGNFCSGYNLKELNDKSDNPPGHFIQNNLTDRYFSKPLIAAVTGYAVGVGFDLALMCDMRIMEEPAVFGYYSRRFGMSISEFSSERLIAMVGFSRAMDLILTGRGLKSEEALNIGIANRVVECGTAIGKALSMANDISKFPQASVIKDKAMLYKYGMPKFSEKHSIVKTNTQIHRQQILEDIKKGSKLFVNGGGKNGKLFSKYLWDQF